MPPLKIATAPRDKSTMTLISNPSPANRPPLPASPNEFNATAFAPVPPVLSTESDQLRNFYNRGPVSQIRMMPLPSAASPSIGAVAQTVVEPVAIVAGNAQATATAALQVVEANTFQGAWSSTVNYVTNNQVVYSGGYYVALQDSLNEEPDTSPTYWQLVGSPNTSEYLGAWSSATAYIVGNQVTLDQNYYICITDNTNAEPDTHPADWQQISSSESFLGAWSSATSYVPGNETDYLGNLWICTVANSNQTPSTTSSYWTLLSSTPSGIGVIGVSGSGNVCYNGDFLVYSSNIPNNFGNYNNGAISITNGITVGGGAIGNSNAWDITANAIVTSTFGFFFGTTTPWGSWQPNTNYIASFYAKLSTNPNNSSIVDDWNDYPATRTWLQNPVLSSTWQLYVFSFNFGSNTIDPNGFFSVNQQLPSGAILSFSCVAVQQGIIPAGWSPSNNATQFLGAWSSSANYTPGNQVTYAGNYYICVVANTNEEPDISPSYWQQIATSETFLGTYSGSEAYVPGNQVVYNGNYWICIAATTGNAPSTTSSYWTLVGTSAILIGSWNSSTAYAAGNEVTYQPSGGATNYYVALQASANEAPGAATNAYWYLLANNTAINSASSYRPTTNPLSAVDAGSSATVTVANFTMNVAGVGAVSVSGGTLTGLSYGTTYYIYYADPTIAGGTVTYQEATTKTSAVSSGVDFFVGGILTPISGGAPTIGNNDGGVGAQIGSNAQVFASSGSTSSMGSWTNFGNTYDANTGTYGNIQCPDQYVTSTWDGFSNISLQGGITSLVLNIKTQVVSATNGAVILLQYSTNGGVSWITVYSVTTTRALTTDQISLPIDTDLSDLQVMLTVEAGSPTLFGEVNFYESWILASN